MSLITKFLLNICRPKKKEKKKEREKKRKNCSCKKEICFSSGENRNYAIMKYVDTQANKEELIKSKEHKQAAFFKKIGAGRQLHNPDKDGILVH